MTELDFRGTVKRGDTGPDIRRVQEWLCLHGLYVKLDGDFGPATAHALERFGAMKGVPAATVVTPLVFAHLSSPMWAAIAAPMALPGFNLAGATLAWATRQLAATPREIGGANSGPWVRLYMGGREGPQWKWCGGFACYCLSRGAETLDVPQPIKTSYGCDTIAERAGQVGILLQSPKPAERSRIRPGSFFLIRSKTLSADWIHVGIVSEVRADSFATIEGNTNDDGSSNGYGVFARVRAYGRADFVLF